MKKVKILDIKIGSVGSLFSALEKAGFDSISVIENIESLLSSDLLIIPGNGNFGKAIKNIDNLNLRETLKEHVFAGGQIVGICLGMQILGRASEESSIEMGLGLIESNFKKFDLELVHRVPHLGWNTVNDLENSSGLSTFRFENDFYFNHSYFLESKDINFNSLTTNYSGFEFVSGVVSDNIIGVQFHPEKSSKAGHSFFCELINWSNV